MFEHSVKVPRVYKAAAGLLKRAESAEGPAQPRLRPLLLELDDRRFNKNAIYALLVEAIKREKSLNEFFDEIRLFESEPRLDRWLTRVLFAELILGKKKLTGDSKPVLTAIKYYNLHKDRLDLLKTAAENNYSTVVAPRYVRINTLRLSAADAVRNFQDEGWNLIRCTGGSYDDYLKQVENLGEYDFLPDYHVKVVFAFPAKTSFVDSHSYQSGELFLQDKATCLAGFLLSPTPGSTVLDMCAAPGMKTTHMASIMRNEGVIYSIERDEERCKVLQQFVDSAGTTCVKVINKDVLTITKNECPNIDYVLLDPSCSGSGIRRIQTNDADLDFQSGRLEKLSRFQAKLLRHALNEFRTAKRVVYSTCSLYPQENEAVIDDVIRNHKGKFRLVSAKERLNGNWNNIGDTKYRGIGEKCIYARPETDYTSGFFIAIFEQEPNEKIVDSSHHIESNINHVSNNTIEEASVNPDSESTKTHKKNKHQEETLDSQSVKENILIAEDLEPKNISKKNKHASVKSGVNHEAVPNSLAINKNESKECFKNDFGEISTENEENMKSKKKSKKKKDKNIESEENRDSASTEEFIPVTKEENVVPKKKSKKKKHKSTDSEENHDSKAEKTTINKNDVCNEKLTEENIPVTKEEKLIPNKKSKKKKNKNLGSEENCDAIVGTSTTNEFDQCLNKKSRKRKTVESCTNEAFDDKNLDNLESTKRKKKKKIMEFDGA